MADNAIDKLFEEIRIAKIEADKAGARLQQAREAMNVAGQDSKSAEERVRLLHRTLDKHIHEGMPVVQAKMQAHEDANEISGQSDVSFAGTIAGSLIAKSITTGRILARSRSSI
jgi:hypothetical protein